jgi:hypothetical protein
MRNVLQIAIETRILKVKEMIMPKLASKFFSTIKSDSLPICLQNARHKRLEELVRRQKIKEEEEKQRQLDIEQKNKELNIEV